ncbi:alpha/beta fold hydrolase [Deinococcus sp. 14RED07]|uniref:alpha/beta hydrolase family protein n=1 Tax=unclassified Deinococcus TaxID=2623546 RepID=UPI001E419C42|nr:MULTISPECIES: alpha/beta fold hydrolase [unclassified Deinococcus]MCD0161212.1 alpha/beta fold hydrolase [Deinococcus sp. 6YEL10]MCD0164057.1 alpha/beta fold hydrolase [Deinococcus sp. 12RED42]MCD0174818.1 alpha/beta fold hydrolase [Deinococcus sp. 14RED07]
MLHVRSALLLALLSPLTAAQTTDHPLSIERMRARTYPGSALTTRQTLSPGANYTRRVVSYQSDGLRINALLTVPNGTPPKGGWPAIVFNHGYIPPNEYRTTERYVAYVDAFARAGFVVLKPDYRGHGSSQGQPAGTSYWSPEYTTDVLNAASSLKTLPGVNKARLGMWGHSMGGHITLRAMVVSPDIKAGVVWAGVVGPYDLLFKALLQWGRGDPNDPRARLLATLGRPERNPAAYRAISPNAYLADLRGRPLQLHHATGDTHVPYSLWQSLASSLKAAGQPVTFYTYAGDNHDLSRNLKAALDRSIAFFKTHL